MMRKHVVVTIAVMLSATVAFASWYDDYDAGMAAVRKGNWQQVVQSMTAAINAKPKENNKERAYGTLFYNYHPYYYRGVAYLNLGQFEKAVADLERAEGIGEENVGSIDTLIQRAKAKLAQASTPEPQPAAPQPAAPQPKPAPVPVPVQPAAPTITPALRQSAMNAVNEADQARTKASARAGAAASPNFSQGMTQLVDARNRAATAKSDDDLNAAIAAAGNAKMFFDSAAGTAVATAPAPVPQPTKTTQATNLTVGSLTQRVHSALAAYFEGDFETASARFSQLTTEMPKNGWIYAFLGASQYSQYAFERDEVFKDKAIESFKKAKKLRFRDGELPSKYFSKRIRKAFREVKEG